MKKSICLLMIAFVMSFGLTSGQAIAGNDGKSYPGANCRPLNKDFNYRVTTTGKIENLGGKVMQPNGSLGTTQFWTCPLVRDEMTSNNTGKGIVYVIDDHTNNQVCCYLYSYTKEGTYVDGASKCTGITFYSSNVTKLEFPRLKESSSGYYFYRCSIPEPELWGGRKYYSGIQSYMLDEVP